MEIQETHTTEGEFDVWLRKRKCEIEASRDRVLAEFEKKYPSGRQLPANVFRALINLVDYNHEERRHYEEMAMNGEDVSDHIYTDIKVISDWMDG